MIGRLYTPEDEVDVLHEDLGRARRHLAELERAPTEGRIADEDEYLQELRRTRDRIAQLERELAGACADQIAAAEAFDQGLTTGLEEWLGGRP